MKNYRVWGKQPYKVAVIHGGPGAPGSIAPVARGLSVDIGILEPFQTEATLEGQIIELHDVLSKHAELPVVLIGHSWGAWLVFIVASRYPAIVKKVIMVGSGPFVQKYAESIVPERLKRLSIKERINAFKLTDIIYGDTFGDKDKSMAQLGELFSKADTYEAVRLEKEPEPLEVSEEINRKVWAEGEALRKSGELLEMGKKIKCPVVAVHGDYDPHLAEGVKKPLTRVLKDFRFILLKKCGHEPWLERYARDEFFRVLREEIASC
jgi:pimeloyl-ACP methyl ester carboxylesterase